MMNKNSTQMLNLLPTGEFDIVKWTKYGAWIAAEGTKIFIHFSDTFVDPRNQEEVTEA